MGTGAMPYQGYEIRYSEYGEGRRPVVLIHDLFWGRHMFAKLAPLLAERGNRVICPDLLGHGDSDHPADPRFYSTQRFTRQTMALLNHLELPTAVVGGVTLGANVALELAIREPIRVEGLVAQMPILEGALPIHTAVATATLLAMRMGRPLLNPLSRLAGKLPRSRNIVEFVVDPFRRSPGPTVDLLNGFLLGEPAPPPEDRREIAQPALVIGPRRDAAGAFGDSRLLAAELPRARWLELSWPFDWKFAQQRLADELCRFLDEVWDEAEAESSVGLPSGESGRAAVR